MSTHVYENTRAYYGDRIVNRLESIVWFLLSLLEILLFFRFFLRLIGANTATAFTEFIYRITAPLVAPFNYIIAPTSSSGSVLEWSTILAIIVYWILAWVAIALLDLVRPVNDAKIIETVERY